MEDVEVAPLRSLDDFLLQSARFQIPETKNLDRWANRVVSNMLYYQTNYFLSALIIFLLVGVLHPAQMMFGCISVFGAFALFVYASNNQAELRQFKKKYSGLSVFIVFLLGYAVIHLFGSVLVFLFGIALPLLAIFIHASLRLRSFKNKVANKAELIGVIKTPMGLLLEALGIEHEAAA